MRAPRMGTDQQLRLRDGRRIGYAEYGDSTGKPVFFFHGTPSSRLFRNPDNSIALALRARIVALDRPGFGLSDFQPRRALLDWPADVAEVADLLGIERFAVVGISGGGPYVPACAFGIPDRLTHATIVSGAGPIDAPSATEGMTPIRRAAFAIGQHAPWLLRPLIWLLHNPRRNPERFFESFSAHFPASDRAILARPEIRAMMIASYAEATRAGLRGLAWETRLFARPWGFRLEDVSMEVHLWHGEEDASTPLPMARYVADAIPSCRATILPREGHLLLFTHWREILRVLVS